MKIQVLQSKLLMQLYLFDEITYINTPSSKCMLRKSEKERERERERGGGREKER